MIRYKIRNLAIKQGYSARKLAAEAGIGHNTAALLMKAKTHEDYNVSVDILDKVCRVLRCQPSDILEYKKR